MSLDLISGEALKVAPHVILLQFHVLLRLLSDPLNNGLSVRDQLFKLRNIILGDVVLFDLFIHQLQSRLVHLHGQAFIELPDALLHLAVVLIHLIYVHECLFDSRDKHVLEVLDVLDRRETVETAFENVHSFIRAVLLLHSEDALLCFFNHFEVIHELIGMNLDVSGVSIRFLLQLRQVSLQ